MRPFHNSQRQRWNIRAVVLYHWLVSQLMYLTAAVSSNVGVRSFSLIMLWISALESIPEVAVQSPALAPPEKEQPGVVHVKSFRVTERP